MTAVEYRKIYTETGRLNDGSILLVHETILDKDGDPAHKVFKNKETVLADAKLSGWKIAGTAPEPVDAEKSDATEQVEEKTETVEEVKDSPKKEVAKVVKRTHKAATVKKKKSL